jgi:hypothetical protein
VGTQTFEPPVIAKQVVHDAAPPPVPLVPPPVPLEPPPVEPVQTPCAVQIWLPEQTLQSAPLRPQPDVEAPPRHWPFAEQQPVQVAAEQLPVVPPPVPLVPPPVPLVPPPVPLVPPPVPLKPPPVVPLAPPPVLPPMPEQVPPNMHDCPRPQAMHDCPRAPHAELLLPSWHRPPLSQQPVHVLVLHGG